MRAQPPTRHVAAAIALTLLAVAPWTRSAETKNEVTQPNVVLIVCDDLNDYATGIPGQAGHPQAQTPNLEKLAASGVAFRRAYSNNPVCAPSRASFLTGIYCHTSGNLFWNKWFWNDVLKNSRTLMEHFKANGYRVEGTGKLMHHHRREDWSHFAHQADYGPVVFDGTHRVAHPSVPEPFRDIGPIDGSFARLDDVPFADDGDPNTGWVYGKWVPKGKPPKRLRYTSESDRDPTPDERNAQWAAQRLQHYAEAGSDQPFFLAVGFIRPHTPLHVPGKYFDLYPLDELELPVLRENDAEDTSFRELIEPESKGLRYFRTLNASYPDLETGLKTFVQAYLASVTAVDECIGQVVDAVDAGPFKDNTILIVTSDHGWQMGQKDFLFKNSPWEESTRIPLVVRAPGVTRPGGVAEHPVSLIDLYPTLVDLCGLEGDTRKNEHGAKLDGHSVRPFLEDPQAREWDGPDGALSMIFGGDIVKKEERNELRNQHWTLRTERWRYIRYRDGSEELYDHARDPHEWTNLLARHRSESDGGAAAPEYAETKQALYEKLRALVGAW